MSASAAPSTTSQTGLGPGQSAVHRTENVPAALPLHVSSIHGNKVHVVADTCTVNKQYSKRLTVAPHLEARAPLVIVPAPLLVTHEAVVFGSAVKASVVFVLGTSQLSDDQRQLLGKHGFVVDSAVTAGIGYVVLRAAAYDGHRYTRDEPSSSLPANPKYYWTSHLTGQVREHISLIPWKW